jgi:hypothetical protein
VSVEDPAPDCYELSFRDVYPIAEPGEVALEDYARTLSRARAAHGLRSREGPAGVRGVHVCGLPGPPSQAQRSDIEDFARSLAMGPERGGLGWS